MPNDPPKYHPLVVRSVEGLLPASDDAGKLSCGVAARCGGCPHFQYPPAEQRALKGESLTRLLKEQGLAPPPALPWIYGSNTRYRNRIRIALRDGVPGYFNEEKDPACAVLEESLLRVLPHWVRWADAHRSALRAYRVAEVRAMDADGVAAVYLRHTERNGAATPAPPRSLLPGWFDSGIVAFEDGPLRTQRYSLTPDAYVRVPVGGFMQVNSEVNRLMVQQVLRWTHEVGAHTALDLFAGSGNFALPLVMRGVSILSVESDVASCHALSEALREQGVSSTRVVAAEAFAEAARMAVSSERFDLVIADPPRGGLRGKVEHIATLARLAVILVGCDAPRFAADAGALVRAGLRLHSCIAVDMFPHTRHMEAMALFLRG